MADDQAVSANFLQEYVLKVLKANGFNDLTEENQKKFLPQFVAEAEKRVGMNLLPKLNEENTKKFVELTKKQDASPEEWWEFWSNNVPDFLEIVKSTLADFAEEVKKILAAV